jgi:hypothetical protein
MARWRSRLSGPVSADQTPQAPAPGRDASDQAAGLFGSGGDD